MKHKYQNARCPEAPPPVPIPKRRITILGFGPSSMERRWDIMRYTGETEIWTLNNGYESFGHILDHVARWYEMHSWEYLKTFKVGVPCHFAELDKIGVPVYVTEHLPKIRKQSVIPWVKVFSHFLGTPEKPGSGSNYALGSPSYMLAHALYEHDHGQPIEFIQSYGIDTSDERHKQQRQSWAYWVSQAHSRGIELGGTMTDFMAEPEMDEGLAGLREAIGDAIAKKLGWQEASTKEGEQT